MENAIFDCFCWKILTVNDILTTHFNSKYRMLFASQRQCLSLLTKNPFFSTFAITNRMARSNQKTWHKVFPEGEADREHQWSESDQKLLQCEFSSQCKGLRAAKEQMLQINQVHHSWKETADIALFWCKQRPCLSLEYLLDYKYTYKLVDLIQAEPSESGALSLRLFASVVQDYLKATSQWPVRIKRGFKLTSSTGESKKLTFNLALAHLL